MSEEALVLTEVAGAVATVRLNRPKALNALSRALMDELIATLQRLDRDDAVRCIVLTGNERAFAAGADIKAMSEASPMQMMRGGIGDWEPIRRVSKPIIAAVSGYALGGGCEVAMMCDIIIASETAQFGQPEINIGVIPGAGGTQRLTRAIGPYKAMEMILTGSTLSAHEALAAGLVVKVCPVDALLPEAQRMAALIAEKPPLAVRFAKEAVRYAAETTVREGLEIERRNFFLLFDTEDQKEGMRAFAEKRRAEFKGE